MTDIRLINLPYQEELLELFECFNDLPLPILLDSNHKDFADTRFDILVADPLATLNADASSHSITWKHAPFYQVEKSDSPFDTLDTLLNLVCEESWAKKAATKLPFTGGVMGYFSYESGRYLETLPSSAIQDVSIPQILAGLYGWAIISLHETKETVLMLTPWCNAETESFILDRIANRKHVSKMPFSLNSRFSSNMSADTYTEKFNHVQHYIRAGDCYQVNLAQRFSAKCHGDNFEAYRALRKSCPTPFSAYINISLNQAILSHSPERFFLCNNGKVESKPIKGTRPRGSSQDEDHKLAQELLDSEKDRAENLMIVDLLRNDMGRSCVTGSIKVPTLFALESYANVHHLVSTITGRISSAQEHFTVFKNGFPGGSITGAPKIRSMEIIDELEPHSRSAYCGSIAYFSSNGQMDSSITIRTLVVDQNNIHCWAGGGLVLDSISHEEYQETFTKVGKLTHTLEENFHRSK
ncbi:aminodeoxychorismate synthase component I [Marinomonas sp. 15G1-11]|uniref:aminodeoxychorismate synthase n=1 Tax=Marinomonas phaeophyticola TaxID=3004091 RepID=A0ABT4JWX5_9GAMM|nr:aminodeoxychorismate synthase component I [Marinomonas sp. 15G1-11]MCZ2722889.1 aminodeoxychorismate synthase component I [Marinomonas sp. 15G1-11]